jgi:Uma2 family endonuclease
MFVDRIGRRQHPDSVVLRDASWAFYRATLREFAGRPSRINYDGGTLEVMEPSEEQEHGSRLLGMMVGQVAITFRVPMAHGGSVTLRRKSRRRGLDTDQCYWIANEKVMRCRTRIDLRVDPPPDLVLEVGVMRAAVNRQRIYAALGVPEMWVLKPEAGLAAYTLEGRGWQPVEHSRSFPFLRVADLNPFVARIGVDDDTSVLADFADWLRRLPAPPRP